MFSTILKSGGKVLGSIVGPVIGLVSDHLEGKRRIKQAQVESDIKVIELQTKHAIDWEVQAQLNSGKSWKDEYWTIILSFPIIALFFPQTADHAEEGFRVMKEVAPEWYVVLLVSIVLTSFGLRPNKSWLDPIRKWKGQPAPTPK